MTFSCSMNDTGIENYELALQLTVVDLTREHTTIHCHSGTCSYCCKT